MDDEVEDTEFPVKMGASMASSNERLDFSLISSQYNVSLLIPVRAFAKLRLVNTMSACSYQSEHSRDCGS